MRVPDWALLPPLVASFVIAPPDTLPFPFYELGVVMLLYPTLVLLGADARTTRGSRVAARWAGALSYPMYLLQAPVESVLARTLPKLTPYHLESSASHGLPLYTAAVLAASFVALRWFDEPVRAWLTRRFAPRRMPPPGAASAP